MKLLSTSSISGVGSNDQLAASLSLLLIGTDFSLASSHSLVHSHLHSCNMGGFCVDDLIASRHYEISNSSIWTSSEEALLSEPTSSSNWYPDWGNSESCTNDGGEPSYMRNNSTYITSSKEECCNKYYFWKWDDCMKEGIVDDDELSSMVHVPVSAPVRGYYPDWSQGRRTCINDGKEPEYMKSWPAVWISGTVEDCCTMHFPWDAESCISAHN
mmetsp:Transcript_12468/g.23501  ORF Transcript_12468/g.23501 Transcript_12468/m.23501 type:complete len:214 (+) Transcript_12468:132-773(+)